MFGKTNSVVSGGSGGGDEIVAINNLGRAVAKNEQVWLNRHIYTANDAKSVNSVNKSHLLVYNLHNKFYYHLESALYRADFKDGVWNLPKIGATSSVLPRSIRFQDGIVWEAVSGTKSMIMQEMGNVVTVTGAIAGDGYMISSKKICTYDPITGDKLEEGGDLFSESAEVVSAFKFGNKLFVGLDNRSYYFYDISDIAAPVLLASGSFPVYMFVVHATGLDEGDYLFAREVMKCSEWESYNLHIYQIKNGYLLERPIDLPQGLMQFVGQKARVSYNNDTQVLSVGSLSKLGLFKFCNGRFSELDINLPTLPATKSVTPYMARLSDDLSTLAITVTSGSDSTNYNIWFYHLSLFDDKWYAENYTDTSSTSFVGFTTQAAEDGEKVSVRTVLPKLFTLTLNVGNDDAEISVKGVK